MLDDRNTDDGGDDIVAAEYVLGVLAADERAAVMRRLETDRAFAGLVDRWDYHLSPLGSAYVEAAPPASVKAALDRRLFASAATRATEPAIAERGGLWASVAFWRGLTVAAVTAMIVAIAIPFLTSPQQQTRAPQYVASLGADGSDVKYLIVYDPRGGDVRLSHVAGERAAGRDFELWMIGSDKHPVSIGVIPVGSATHLELADAVRKALAQGALLAVSVEPQGGSPTGQPTGPVVAAGDLRAI